MIELRASILYYDVTCKNSEMHRSIYHTVFPSYSLIHLTETHIHLHVQLVTDTISHIVSAGLSEIVATPMIAQPN